MASIRQDVSADFLPDFRNLGVLARVLVGVNALLLGATMVEPLLIASLLALALFSTALARLPYWLGCAAVLAIVLAIAAAMHAVLAWALGEPLALAGFGRTLVLTGLIASLMLGYFRLLLRAYSPALAEARLQALQARIRPHFLFNSLNAVLSLIRRDPRRAERALEDLADLFRTLMGDARRFVRLADEIALLERYAEIEQLRLGDRLRITWELDTAPPDALLPALVLQPLLENAIYHGVEPGTAAGDVLVRIERRGERVHAAIENPYIEAEQRRAGNRMALDNVRERLALFFDAEARLEARAVGSRFRIDIEMPYRAAKA